MRTASAIFLALLIATCSSGQLTSGWIGSWAASQQIPEPENALAPDDLRDATLRQIVHLSAGGPTVRIHISNVFGTAPLHLTSVYIARPVSTSSAAIDPASDRPVTFHGENDVLLLAGAEFISDPLEYPVAPLSDLAITIHFDSPPAQQTGHPGSRATSYLVHGDLVSVKDLPNAKRVDHWYQLSGVDVAAPPDAASIVVLGDSITDGHGATINGNDRWPDVLARRLQNAPALRNRSVLNQGIGGNHLLTDGLGPNALARFDRDVLAQPGGLYLIVLKGINDSGGLTRINDVSPAEHAAFVQRLIASYEQIIARARTHGIQVIGATILPFVGSDYYHPGPASEADRQAVNKWIRAAGHFDSVVDFDQVVRDAAQPGRMLPAFDSGDHLHPSPAGYAAMADSVPLRLFGAALTLPAQLAGEVIFRKAFLDSEGKLRIVLETGEELFAPQADDQVAFSDVAIFPDKRTVLTTRWMPLYDQPSAKAERKIWRRRRWRAAAKGLLWTALLVYAFYFVFWWNQPTNGLERIGSALPAFLLLAPVDYLTGAFFVLFTFSRSTFLLGHPYAHGVWFFYPVVFALKSQLGFWDCSSWCWSRASFVEGYLSNEQRTRSSLPYRLTCECTGDRSG